MANKYDPEKHHRRSIRLKDYNYTQSGAYFITICSWDRQCIFGDLLNGEMRLNEYGRVVDEYWHRIRENFQNVEIDKFVIMPNQFH